METENEYWELKSWLEKTRDEPLEAMDAFFDRRIESYEAHMSPWRAYYEWMAKLLPKTTDKKSKSSGA